MGFLERSPASRTLEDDLALRAGVSGIRSAAADIMAKACIQQDDIQKEAQCRALVLHELALVPEIADAAAQPPAVDALDVVLDLAHDEGARLDGAGQVLGHPAPRRHIVAAHPQLQLRHGGRDGVEPGDDQVDLLLHVLHLAHQLVDLAHRPHQHRQARPRQRHNRCRIHASVILAAFPFFRYSANVPRDGASLP